MCYSDYGLGSKYEKMSIQASVIDSDIRMSMKNGSITILSRIKIYDTQELLCKIEEKLGKKTVGLVLALFAYTHPEYFCCECKDSAIMCDNCASINDYIQELGSFNEILLAYYMEKVHELKWDNENEEWR